MVSTGMRIGALPGLLLEDVKKIDEFGLYLIRVSNNSKKRPVYLFLHARNAVKRHYRIPGIQKEMR